MGNEHTVKISPLEESMELFSMFLDSEVDWGFGRALTVIAKCLACGQEDRERIANLEYNDLYCSNCHADVNQFTNACEYTINRSTNEIGQGCLWVPGPDWVWERPGGRDVGMLQRVLVPTNRYGVHPTQTSVAVPVGLRVVGMKRGQVVVSTVFSDFNSEEVIFSTDHLFSPSKWDFADSGVVSLPAALSSHLYSGQIVAVDVILRSKYGDQIGDHRRLIRPRR